MYTADSAIGVRFGTGKRWEQINLATVTVQALVTTYRRWQLTLHVPSAPTVPLYLDGDVIRLNWPNFVGTIADLLTSLGDASLPTTPTGIVLNMRTAQYKDAFKAGYAVTPVTHANSDSSSIAAEDKHDIRLTRTNPATDYTEFYRTCLVSINGFYHQTDTDGANGVVVTDAMKSLRHADANQIGLYNFKNVGKFEFVPITDAMINVPDIGKARVALGKDLTDKTVFLVLGGYFMVVDPTLFYRVGDSTYVIDFNKLPMKDRWFESGIYIDLSAMPVESTPNNEFEIDEADLTSEDFIRAYLQMSQSFFCILDTPEVFVNRQFIKRTRLPDMYTAYKLPVYPMVTALGRHPEYWATAEDKKFTQWSLTIKDSIKAKRVYNTLNQNSLEGGIDNANEPMKRGDIAMAHFLEIGRDV